MARTLRIAHLAGLLILLTGYLSGCSRSQAPAPTTASAPAAEKGHDHEHEHERQAKDEKTGKEAKPPEATVESAKKGVESESEDAIVQSISNLTGFLQSDDKRLVAEAGQVLLDTAKTHRSTAIRASAVAALGERAEVFMDDLIALTQQGQDPSVRIAAIGSLSKAKPGSAADKRLQELAKGQDDTVKKAAVTALTALRAGAGAGELVSLIAQLGNSEGDQSAQAAIALTLKDKEALPFLEEAIRKSPDAKQRHAAAMCVGLICAGTNPSQQKFAKAAHSTRKGEAPVHPSYPEGLPILQFALKDSDPMVREIAAQGLGYLGDTKATPLLAKALGDPDTHVRRRAASALCTVPAEAAQSELERAATSDKDADVRRAAVEALGWIGTSSVGPALARAAGDSSSEVRRAAAVQMGRIKDKTVLTALVGLFKDPNDDVRWSAVQAVAGLRDKEATQYLVKALDDPVPQVANAAEAGLQRLGIAKRKLPGAD